MKIAKRALTIVLEGMLVLIGSSCCAEEPTVQRGVLEPAGSSQPEESLRRRKTGETEFIQDTLSTPIEDKSKSEVDDQTHASKALHGGVIQNEINGPEDSLSGAANREVAAIGISWNLFNRVIKYVDPGSDLFGKVEPGKDRFLGLGELDAVEVVRSAYNIGESGTWVDAVIRGPDHIVRHIPVRRQGLSNFTRQFARSLARQYKLSR